jgi:hypothetical protein
VDPFASKLTQGVERNTYAVEKLLLSRNDSITLAVFI